MQIGTWLVVGLAISAAFLLAPSEASAQRGLDPNAPLTRLVRERLRNGQVDAAEHLARMPRGAPPEEIAAALVDVAQRRKPDEALAILDDVVTKYPHAGASYLAYWRIAQLRAERGDIQGVIDAVRSGRAAEIEEAKRLAAFGKEIPNARNLQLLDCYLPAEAWQKGLDAYSKLPPPAGICGTCDAFTRMRRNSSIALCLLNLKRTEEAANLLLPSLEYPSGLSQPYLIFMLLRMYQEADQLDDFQVLCDAAAERRREELGLRRDRYPPENREAIVTFIATEMAKDAAVLTEAIDLARSEEWDLHIAHSRGKLPGSGELLHLVSQWRLRQNPAETVPLIVEAAKLPRNEEWAKYGQAPYYDSQLVRLLASMHSPIAEAALGEIGEKADHQERKSIANAVARDLGDRFRVPITEAWPSVAPGSLPKQLPPRSE
jgi:hypothetical protein